jgi:hypothetical protein
MFLAIRRGPTQKRYQGNTAHRATTLDRHTKPNEMNAFISDGPFRLSCPGRSLLMGEIGGIWDNDGRCSGIGVIRIQLWCDYWQGHLIVDWEMASEENGTAH